MGNSIGRDQVDRIKLKGDPYSGMGKHAEVCRGLNQG